MSDREFFDYTDKYKYTSDFHTPIEKNGVHFRRTDDIEMFKTRLAAIIIVVFFVLAAIVIFGVECNIDWNHTSEEEKALIAKERAIGISGNTSQYDNIEKQREELEEQGLAQHSGEEVNYSEYTSNFYEGMDQDYNLLLEVWNDEYNGNSESAIHYAMLIDRMKLFKDYCLSVDNKVMYYQIDADQRKVLNYLEEKIENNEYMIDYIAKNHPESARRISVTKDYLSAIDDNMLPIPNDN